MAVTLHLRLLLLLLACCASVVPASRVGQQLVCGNGIKITFKDFFADGGFSTIYEGERQPDGSRVAIKIAWHEGKLAHEASVMRRLHGVAGFPRLLSYQSPTGGAGGHQDELIVQDMLGPSLHELWTTTTRSTRFSTPTVLRIGRGILDCLERLHERDIVHNDLKPANVLLGVPGSLHANDIHLIDFGSATSRAVETQEAEEQLRASTPLFASLAAHEAKGPHPIDDIESLVYLLAFLGSGSLPWAHCARDLAFQHGPTSLTASLKREAMFGGCTASRSEHCLDECSVDRRVNCEITQLERTVCSKEMANVLRGLWRQVLARQQDRRATVDYDACRAALTRTGNNVAEDVPFDWDL